MNLQQLTTFIAVLNEKSMTAAAQKLFLTQSAVSQQIRQLEDELGIELLVRGVRQVTPTPAGEVLLDYAKRIQYLVQQAELAVQTVGAEVKGPLRIGTLNSIGLHLISPIFGLFLKNNQDVALKLRYGGGSEILEWLSSGEADLAVLPDVKKEYGASTSSYEARFVAHDEMWLAVSPKEYQSATTKISIKDLASRPIAWLSSEYPGFENALSKEVKRAGLHLRPVFESSNVGTVKRVIESGVGWGFLPAHSIRKQVRTGRLKRIEVEDFEYSVDMICYFPKNLKSLKALDVFLKVLQGQLSS
ncbi:MAG TPA: LysR family transcriptional regulator [Bdellovibrionales bacterium]|nr:LysR family transcriptional regulator [Bdellovibrionales bacterium]